jgi:hypothetical protein
MIFSKEIFKVPANGRWITKGLFYEGYYDGEDRGSEAIFTIKDQDIIGPDGRKYISLKKLYLEAEDPTEYEFATKYLGGWEHWKQLAGGQWFEPILTEWRAELQVKLQSRALKNLMFEAENNGKNSYDANKFLIAKGYLPKETILPGKRGRPSKDEVKLEAQRQAEMTKKIEEDIKRLEIN